MATTAVNGVLARFTTEPAVRAGVVTAGWSAAASFARGAMPRSPVQQAATTGAVMTAHYEIGATVWAAIASTAAGLPGSKAGTRALITAAAVSGLAAKAVELELRPVSGESLLLGSTWSGAKLVSVIGLAGGLVTLSDVVVHETLGLPRSPSTTMALDLAAGALMAGGTTVRRRRRAQALGEKTSNPLGRIKASTLKGQVVQAAQTGGAVLASTVGLGLLAVGEQAAARGVASAVNSLAGEDLEEFSTWVGHSATFGGFALSSYFALRAVRQRLEHKSAALEPAYDAPPTNTFVSAGPTSAIEFETIGREGRRFVAMRLSVAEIQQVMNEDAIEPVRVVIPSTGSTQQRAHLAVAELIATAGIDRSLICIAAPTGVGYVNYVMAEALEYLARGDCAIVVPQYAYVPSVLALNKTTEGTQLQLAVIEAVRMELARRGSDARVVQFGESLGAQVAVDVGGPDGSAGFRRAGLAAGLYVGVPFRSSLWRTYLRDSAAMIRDGVIVLAASSNDLTDDVAGHHVLLNHHGDPINMFAWSMVVQRPPWLGAPDDRPPGVPRETYFRPLTSLVLAMVDVFNGMQSKPGEFRRFGHDYRIDLREALQKTFGYHLTPEQTRQVESALRRREQDWAEVRLVARTGTKALENLTRTIGSWGADQPEGAAQSRLIEYLNSRMGSQPAEPEEDLELGG